MKRLLLAIFVTGLTFASSLAQRLYNTPLSAIIEDRDSFALRIDSIIDAMPDSLLEPTATLPATMFLPATFTGYDSKIARRAASIELTDEDAPGWVRRNIAATTLGHQMRQQFAILNPDRVPYNLFNLPAPPEQYVLVADPERAIMVFREVPKPEINASVGGVDVTQQDWLNKLGILIQFSQGYVSPNWYQGGNSALNLITDFTYNSKLNDKFHPRLLFENSFQWRTALTLTQDDPYRKYSLTENRFQINSKFGYKAFYNWYYSVSAMFKTPILNGYKKATNERTASFLSPGEFNLGLGMTYNYTNKKKTFNVGITIAPLSYNLKTVIDPKINETGHGLEEGHKTKSAYGSNAEINWSWQICYNVQWKARIFGFTNYEYFQGDWQNSFNFTINRFMSAQLKVDMRWDTSRRNFGPWKRLQLNEYFSLGFNYTIAH